MIPRTRLFASVLLGMVSLSHAADPDPTFKWTSNGVKEQLVIPAEKLAKSPPAEPEKGKLPVTFAEAELLAVKTAGISKTGLGELELRFVQLDGERKWFYMARFGLGDAGTRGVAVLMDGTAIRSVILEAPQAKQER